MNTLSLTLLFSLLLTSYSAFAGSNRVGDESMLVGNFSGQQVILKSQITKHVAAEGKFLVKNITTVPGQGTFTEDTLVTEDEIMTPEKAELIIVMCPQVGGVVEELTLSMGRFTTCKISVQDAMAAALIDTTPLMQEMGDDTILKGALWLGNFPIQGIGRIITPDQTLSLESFRWAK